MADDIIDLCGTSSEEEEEEKKVEEVVVLDDDDDDDDDIIILENSPEKPKVEAPKKRAIEKTKTPPRIEAKRKRKGPGRRLKKEREMIRRNAPKDVSIVSAEGT